MRHGDHNAGVAEADGGGVQQAPALPSFQAALIRPGTVLLLVPALCVVVFLALPLLAIFLKVLPQAGLWQTLRQPLVVDALWLSTLTSLCSLLLAVLFGTPVAYLLARHRFRGAGLVETLLDLPMVLPPTVAGVALLMTLGEDGMCLFERGRRRTIIPTVAQEVFDVAGAGDTVIATFTLALASGATFEQAARMANHAAGVVVGKVGVAVVTPAELRAKLAAPLTPGQRPRLGRTIVSHRR